MPKTMLAILAAALLGGCVATVSPSRSAGGPPPPPPPRGDHRPDRDHHPDRDRPRGRVIEGVVRDAVTKQPIDKCGVDIDDGSGDKLAVITGPDGRYRTREIPRGPFSIRFRREGYEMLLRQAQMDEGIARIDVELTPERGRR